MTSHVFWTLVIFISAFCGMLAVSGDTSEYKLQKQSVPGRQTYFDKLKEGFHGVSQVQDLTENDDRVQEIYQLWSDLVSAAPIHGVQEELGSDLSSASNSGQSLLMSAILDTVSAAASNGSRCAHDTAHVVMSMLQRQEWALSYLDAAGKPGASLKKGRFQFVGNYKQCREIVTNSSSFGANYVVITLVIGEIDPTNPLSAVRIVWGLCMPSTCSNPDITELVQEVVFKLNLNGTLQVLPAEIRDSKREYTTATILSIIVICIIGSLMILGTAFDVIFLQWPKWKLRALANKDGLVTTVERDHENTGYQPIMGENRSHAVDDGHIEGTPLLGKPLLERRRSASCADILSKTLLAFSVYTNGSKVLNTSQPPGSLTCVHGIRFLSMSWVILGHCIGFSASAMTNVVDLLAYMKRWTFDAISNATVSVDTFFTLSGLLTAYVVVKEMKKRSWKLNWGLIYFHRYWRLTPPYMLTILLVLGLQRFLGEGELWAEVQPADKKFCEENWWTNLLYINNFVDFKKICFGHSWYLSNDMQFFLVSPLMLIPFYFHAYAGFACCMAFLLTTTITTGALSAENGWYPLLIEFYNETLVGDLEVFFGDYYIKPWCRIGPYVIGIMTGYLLVCNNNKVHMNRSQVIIGWAVAVASALAIIYGMNPYLNEDELPTISFSAFYNAVARTAWGVCVCWVIIACVSGYGGFVNTLLSWSPFVVLGRLTYMSYLIHPMIIYVYLGNMGQLFYAGDLNFIVFFLGILFLTYMVAFVLMLGLESPMIGLEKVFLPQRKKD